MCINNLIEAILIIWYMLNHLHLVNMSLYENLKQNDPITNLAIITSTLFSFCNNFMSELSNKGKP